MLSEKYENHDGPCGNCGHYSHGGCWEAAMDKVREAGSEMVDAVVELEKVTDLLAKHQWEPHDESRDYCIECGGTKPEPEDFMPMGHVKGCALAMMLRTAGYTVCMGGVTL